MNVKKTISMILCAVLLLFLFVGCSSNSGTTTPANTAETPKETEAATNSSSKGQRINIATATSGGAFYTAGLATSQLLQDVAGIQASASTSAGSVENVTLLANKEANVVVQQSDVLVDAYNGVGSFEGKAHPDMRILVPILSQQYHIMVRKGSGIESMADWKGKNIVVGRSGSGASVTTERILKCAGISFNDIVQSNLGFSEGIDSMRNGATDAMIVVGASPVGTVSDALATSDSKISLYEMTAEEEAAILKDNPYMAPMDIIGGTYKGYDKDVNAIGHLGFFVVNADMDDQLAYDIVMTMYKNSEKLFSMNVAFNGSAFNDPQLAIDTVKVPMHPGAEKALRELGLYK